MSAQSPGAAQGQWVLGRALRLSLLLRAIERREWAILGAGRTKLEGVKNASRVFPGKFRNRRIPE